MTDYLTNLAARSLNKASVIRPRVPTRFESPYKKEPFSQKESWENEETDSKKELKQYAMNSFETEDVQVEPEMFFSETKQLPISKSQTLTNTRIINKIISRQTQTQVPQWHEVISHRINIQQPEQAESELAENTVVRNDNMEASQVFSTSTPKLKRAIPYEHLRVSSKREIFTTQSPNGSFYINNPDYADEISYSLERLKSIVDKTQKPSIADAIEVRKNAITPEKQYMKANLSESDIIKASLPEKKVKFDSLNSFTNLPRSGLTFTPEVIKKHSPVLENDSQKIAAEEKSIQVTIGRIEIRAVPQAMPQKQQRTPKALSLEDYSKRHT